MSIRQSFTSAETCDREKNQQLPRKYLCRRAACHNVKVNQLVSNKKDIHVDSVNNFNTQKRLRCRFKPQENNEHEQIE